MLLQGSCYWLSPASERKSRYLAYDAVSIRSDEVSEAIEKALLSDLGAPIFDDGRYQSDLRIFALRVASRHASKDPSLAPPGFGADAVQRYFSEGLELTGSRPRQRVRLILAVALYYNAAGQSGRALRELEQLRRWSTGEAGLALRIAILDALATVYEGMGQLDQRDRTRQEALDFARKFHLHGRHEEQEYRDYHDLLLHRMADLTQRSGPEAPAAELRGLWELLRPLANQYVPLPVRYLSHYRSAVYLAEAGQPQLGLEVIRRWQDRLEELKGKRALDEAESIEGQCFLGRIHLAAGEDEQAGRYLEQCLRSVQRVEQREPLLHQALGLSYERRGAFARAEAEYRKDREYIESLRKSYPVEQRAAFFNSRVRASYWGLIRSTIGQTAGRALDDPACGKLLAYSEWIRARQLTELTEQRSCALSAPVEGPGDSIDVAALRRVLPVRALLLDYVMMERHLALLAVSGTQCRASLLPLAPGFAAQLQGLNQRLANPTYVVEALSSELAALGAQVLGPTRDLLRQAQELVVLPDGPLNLVPFELLSLAPAGGYRPLIDDHVVRLWPSLRAQACPPRPRPRRLLAVADPDYPDGFKRLGDTLGEVCSIATLFPTQAKILAQAEAREAALKQEPDWAAYTHVHLATHGVFGKDRIAGLNEPALVLTREPAAGAQRSGEDGFLTASEASRLRLDADLAVLSACQTGAGRYEIGEGVLGLGRAFLAAGSRAALMSLWPVDSTATVLLMEDFYRHLLKDGDDAALALRKAKLYVRSRAASASPPRPPAELPACRPVPPLAGEVGTRSSAPAGPERSLTFSHPAYWAGFVLLSKKVPG